MRRILLCVCLAFSATLQGCAERRIPPEFQAQTGAPYILGPGDRLRVIVFGQDSLSNSFNIGSSGSIDMPLIGLVPSSGRSTSQVEREIEAKLRNGYVREPRVSVEVEAYRPFFVLGEVTTAGQYPYVSGMTVETAVAIAGGYTPRARKNEADLTRVEDGRAITAKVPVTATVKPGDTVFVHERFF